MKRTLIVARIKPGTENEIAGIFAESDATSLPIDLGVRQRELYALGDAYIHLVEFDQEAENAMVRAREHPGFLAISAALEPYVSPYDPPNWKSPRDAMARRFYHWRRHDSR